MRFFLLITIVIFGLAACKKGKLDVSSFWDCNKSQNLDSAAISSKLIGEWSLTKQACAIGSGSIIAADRNIEAAFRTDRTFVVSENDTIVTLGNWKLIQGDNNTWELELSSESNYLNGRILFCGDQVLFNDSYRDGCDNLFTNID
jgi:hypothetical protein